jgi:hypothetical protein
MNETWSSNEMAVDIHNFFTVNPVMFTCKLNKRWRETEGKLEHCMEGMKS